MSTSHRTVVLLCLFSLTTGVMGIQAQEDFWCFKCPPGYGLTIEDGRYYCTLGQSHSAVLCAKAHLAKVVWEPAPKCPPGYAMQGEYCAECIAGYTLLVTPVDQNRMRFGCDDLSGLWQQETGQSGSSQWLLTRRGDGSYDAVEQGLGSATGTAALRGRMLRIEWTTGD